MSSNSNSKQAVPDATAELLQSGAAAGSQAAAVAGGRVFMLGDTELIEVEVDENEPEPIDDGASDQWSDIGDNVRNCSLNHNF
jgi:hypothetical protein